MVKLLIISVERRDELPSPTKLLWGVRTILDCCQRCDVSGRGSVSNTSRTAPLSLSQWRAESKGFSSMREPRERLTSTAPDFISANVSSLKKWLVWGVEGRARMTTSAEGRSEPSSDSVCTDAKPGIGRGVRAIPMTLQPKAAKREAQACPTAPQPRMRTCLPHNSESERSLLQHFCC